MKFFFSFCKLLSLDVPTSFSSRTGDMIKFSINYPADPTASVNMCKPALIGCLAKCGPWKKGKRPESVCYSQGRILTIL